MAEALSGDHAIRARPEERLPDHGQLPHATSTFSIALLNCITTEDGGEAGVFSEKNLAQRCPRGGRTRHLLPVEGGYLVNNIGRFRIFENLSEGWKPVMIESNLREVGVREKDFMRPQRQQLAMAEPMMFNVSNEAFVDLRFAHDLYRGTPDAVAAWKAIGQYNGFFAEHAEYYRGATLGGHAGHRLGQPERRPSDHERPGRPQCSLSTCSTSTNSRREKLKPYAAVALLAADTMRDRAIARVGRVRSRGRKAVRRRPRRPHRDENGKPPRSGPPGSARSTAKAKRRTGKRMPPIDELAKTLLAADRPPPVRVEAPTGVLYNVTRTGRRRAG